MCRSGGAGVGGEGARPAMAVTSLTETGSLEEVAWEHEYLR